MTGNAGTDFRIKLLVVHPDGRRQKFLVTFPERRTLKIDQRYIGLPLTLRVDFVPGAIICRPGTGHSLSIAGKPVKEHSLTVNDVVGLDQYNIEFLELPEPLPMEEATRFVSISDVSEATVVVSSRGNDAQEFTPLPAAPTMPHRPQPPPTPAYVPPPVPPAHAQPVSTPKAPDFQPQMYRPDPEDSTAVIRRLQVPGHSPGGSAYQNFANLQATGRTGDTATGVTLSGINGTATGTGTGLGSDPLTGAPPSVRFTKKHIIAAATSLGLIAAYLTFGHGAIGKIQLPSTSSTELDSQAGPDSPSAPQDSGEMKPMDLPDNVPVADMNSGSSADSQTTPIIPAPQAIAAPVPMATGGPTDSPFDDKTGFDPMAVDSFFDAVDAGDEAKIKDLLDKRLVDINLSKRRGYAALHLAAARGDLATVKFLIKMKADPNVIDGSGASPVMWSVFRRHEDVVKFLAGKTNLKIARQGGETAFDLAKRMKMTRVLKALDPEPKKSTAKNKAPAKKRVPTSLPKKK